MKNYLKSNTYIISLWIALTAAASAAGVEPVWSLAQKEKPALLETLKQLTAIESGSREPEELDKIAKVLSSRLQALGAKVEVIEATEADTVRLSDTPDKLGKMVKATFSGTGTKKILLMAHMDTVYPRGMAVQQPYRIDGDRAYGLGIADARGGIATILHALAILKTMNYRDYGIFIVFINPDEEIGSPGSRNHHMWLGAQHD
ncbi:MAG TPA: M20/M25/M40 family metallo-hydrolase, partial [Burkholderiales bacterium]|nr:M20/M25/M40 family metallo-hydrolase [Burkholderiales bacterium]